MRSVASSATVLLAGAVAALVAGGSGADGAGGKPELPRMKRVSATFDKTTDTIRLKAVFAQPLKRKKLRRTQLLLDIGLRTGAPQQVPAGGSTLATSRACEGGLHAQLRLGRGKVRVYRIDDGDDPGRTVALRMRRDRRAVTAKLRWPFDERPACLGGVLDFFEGWDVGDHDDEWFLKTDAFDRKGRAVAKPVPAPSMAVGEPD